MLVLNMPITFHVGDTAECQINLEPRHVTWSDQDTLVLDHDPKETRRIFATVIDASDEPPVRRFMCASKRGAAKPAPKSGIEFPIEE